MPKTLAIGFLGNTPSHLCKNRAIPVAENKYIIGRIRLGSLGLFNAVRIVAVTNV